jgi:hypothetical protein
MTAATELFMDGGWFVAEFFGQRGLIGEELT